MKFYENMPKGEREKMLVEAVAGSSMIEGYTKAAKKLLDGTLPNHIKNSSCSDRELTAAK